MRRRAPVVSLLQASENSASLSRLMDLNRESQSRLQAACDALPPNLKSCVAAGPYEGGVWCLLVSNPSALAKVRQLLPDLMTQLTSKGLAVSSIRLKVQKS